MKILLQMFFGFAAVCVLLFMFDQHNLIKEQREQIKQLTQENKDVRNDLGACQGDMRGER